MRTLVGALLAMFLVGLLAGCETVTETLVLNETGTGSLIIEWNATDEQFNAAGVSAERVLAERIDRPEFGNLVDATFGTDGYVLSDRVAYNSFRGDRTGMRITVPLRDFDDARSLGADDLQTGRPPVLLWRNASIVENDDGTVAVRAEPDVADRKALVAWASSEAEKVVGEDMIFVAEFTPRGQILDHNADEVDGSTLRWRLGVDDVRDLSVLWEPGAPDTPSAAPFLAGLLIVIAGVATSLYIWEKRSLGRQSDEVTTT